MLALGREVVMSKNCNFLLMTSVSWVKKSLLYIWGEMVRALRSLLDRSLPSIEEIGAEFLWDLEGEG
jgi:hypothetical protein